MLKRILNHQEVVKIVLTRKFPTLNSAQKTTLNRCALTNSDWEMIKTVHDILEPFEVATRVLSGQYYPTLALAQITINILRLSLQPKDTDTVEAVIIKNNVLKQLVHYFDNTISKEQQKIMLVSAPYSTGSELNSMV